MPTGVPKKPNPRNSASSSINLRLHGNPNPSTAIRSTPARAKRDKLFSRFLEEFYTASPHKLKALVQRCHDHATKGHARFAELIIDRLEGPVKHEVEHSGVIGHVVTEAERERALRLVDELKAMDEKTIEVKALPEGTSGDESEGTTPRSDSANE